MITRRIHITGPSGAGVTTLGRALASAVAVPHHDVDDYYWLPTSDPFTRKRAVGARLRLMGELFLDRPGWVLSGSINNWGDELGDRFDLVIWLNAPAGVREKRLRDREGRAFGADVVTVGGRRYEATEAFIAWAMQYDDRSFEGRNVARHEAWVAKLTCPVLKLDGTERTDRLVASIGDTLGRAT